MSRKYRGSMSDQLTWAHTALNNALQSPEVLAALSKYGYDEAKIQQGLALYETALAQHAAHDQAAGKKLAATQVYNDAWRIAHSEHYAVHRHLARLVLKDDPERYHALRLDETRPTNFTDWLDQAIVFYTNALDDPGIVEALTAFDVTAEALQGSYDVVLEAGALKDAQQRRIAEARDATVERNQARDALHTWMNHFRQVARRALAKERHHLDAIQLGSVANVRTEPTSVIIQPS